MNLLRPCLGGALALGLLLSPTSSEAASIRLNLGGDYWIDNGGIFQANLAVETPLISTVTVGGRFGALLATKADTLGIPVDLVLRAAIAKRRVYIEGSVGPWIFLEGEDNFKAHAAFGFGIQGKSLSLGMEVGWLDPEPIVGLRLGFRF